MNDPIDILEIAAKRYANALNWLNSTRQMNSCENAAVAMAYAGAMLDVARDDLWRARQLSNDVTLAIATGQLDGASIAKLESLPGRTDAPSQSPPER